MAQLNTPISCSDHPFNVNPEDCIICFLNRELVTTDANELAGTSDAPGSVYPEIDDGTLAGSRVDQVHRQTVPTTSYTSTFSLRNPAPSGYSDASRPPSRRLVARFNTKIDCHDFYSERFALSPEQRPETYSGENHDFYNDRFALSDCEEQQPKRKRGRKPKPKPDAKVPEFMSLCSVWQSSDARQAVEKVKDAKAERIKKLERELEHLREVTTSSAREAPKRRSGRKPRVSAVRIDSEEESTTETEDPDEKKRGPKARKSRKTNAKKAKAALLAQQLKSLFHSESSSEESQPSRPARKQAQKKSPAIQKRSQPRRACIEESQPARRGRKRRATEIREEVEEEQHQPPRKSRRKRAKVSYAEDSD